MGSPSSVHGPLQHWINAAEMGHVRAKWASGSVYLTGKEAIMRNVKLATRLLQEATDAGHDGSCHEIGKLFFQGFMCAQGLHVSQDFKKAVQLYRQAARQDTSGAHRALGNAYLHGHGVDKVRCYILGRGIQQDYAKAAQCIFLAAEGGIAKAQLCLAQLLERKRSGNLTDRKKAVGYYQLAAKGGLQEAARALGRQGAPS
ncbi:unnamed protein product [Peronospora belbahrii]|uniref:Uncharacterized protein n=1 Tax=Peronospora belbahrii TaxID=622444 RepID=A0AAU9L7J6_9STRA|nr:unnamed protein product [Peronospora belbahrii]CAH0514345.1 unnamed protein product [Peronospora belbahrii]